MSFDPRVTLARPDLADATLEGIVAAARFTATRPAQAVIAAASLRAAPRREAEQLDQLLFGELFDVLEAAGEYAWGRARRDGYVGFVEMGAIDFEPVVPTHWVKALRTFAFAEPSIKSPARGPLSLNALVTVIEHSGTMSRAARVGWIATAHLAPVGASLESPAAVAQAFLGTPYLWGGRESVGLDCSGLVQQALYACGRACPRDTDQQARLGKAVQSADLARGDLVFWRGHVGMMMDATHLAHANAHHMEVAIEPLSQAVTRIAASGGGEPAALRRLSG